MADNIQEEIEDKIIDDINSAVTGRLIIYKPDKKGMEDYLAVERRGKYKEGAIYFQINSVVGHAEDNKFIKDFSKEGFRADGDFYLLFVYFDEVLQKVSDYIWLIPSLRFRDIAEVIKSPDGKNFLRFQAPLDVREKNQYSKFVINTKELGKIILDALEKGGKFTFSEVDFEENIAVNSESLKDFLCEARKGTYASGANPVDNPRLLASKQFEFQKGDYSYRDVYFSGDKKFMGQEIVYCNAKPIWGMNYIGTQMGKLETDFLKESLFKLAEKCRMGGVCEYKKRELKYQDEGQGSLKEFSGIEGIFLEGKNIYTLNYQGGLISDTI